MAEEHTSLFTNPHTLRQTRRHPLGLYKYVLYTPTLKKHIDDSDTDAMTDEKRYKV